MKPSLKEQLSALLSETLSGYADASRFDVDSSFEIPREEKFGDLSSNLILKLAKDLKKPPRPLAEEFSAKLKEKLQKSAAAGRIEKIAVEGPGFLHFYYSAAEIISVVPRI